MASKDASRVGSTLVVALLLADAVRKAGDQKGRPYSETRHPIAKMFVIR